MVLVVREFVRTRDPLNTYTLMKQGMGTILRHNSKLTGGVCLSGFQ